MPLRLQLETADPGEGEEPELEETAAADELEAVTEPAQGEDKFEWEQTLSELQRSTSDILSRLDKMDRRRRRRRKATQADETDPSEPEIDPSPEPPKRGHPQPVTKEIRLWPRAKS